MPLLRHDLKAGHPGHARLGNYELARGYARQALEAGTATGDPTVPAMAWDTLGVAHSRLGEPRQAMGCYRQGLALSAS